MLDWAGEVPANPGVTGNQNSNTPTCAHSVIWDVRSSVKSGHGSEMATPAGGYKSVMSSMFCCNRHNLESTARKVQDDETAIRPHVGCCRR